MAVQTLLLAAGLISGTNAALAVAQRDDSANQGFFSVPIVHETTIRPLMHRDINRRALSSTLYNVSAVSYLVQLSIGTPGQLVKVAIDTGSDELWVNPNCNSATITANQQRECVANGKYTPGQSSTSKKLTGTNRIPYGKGDVNIQYYTDNIGLANSTTQLKNVQFGSATASNDLNEGIMGLAYGMGTNLDYNNFVDDLTVQNVTALRAFTIALGSVDVNNGGVIIFGGVDTKKFSGKLASLPILGPQGRETIKRYWVTMDSVGMNRAGSSKVYYNTATPIVIDSGSSLSYLPSRVVQSMVSDLNGQLDRQSGLYLVSCSAATRTDTVDFTFSGNTIRVPMNEFIWNVDGKSCVFGAATLDSGSGITALLGDTFMRSAYTVFDQTNNVINIGQYVNCGTNEQAIPSSGASGFTGECQAGQGTQAKNPNAAGRSAGSPSVGLWAAAGVLLGAQLVSSWL